MSGAKQRQTRSEKSLMTGALVLAHAWLMACGTVEVATDLDPEVARLAVARLEHNGVRVDLHTGAAGRAAIAVDVVDVPAAVEQLQCTALQEQDSCLEMASSILPTPRQDQARLRNQRECQLSRDLVGLPGVRRGRIRLAIPEATALDDTTEAIGAGVWLQVGDGFDEGAVRRYLLGAVPALSPDAIHLVATNVRDQAPRAPQRFAHLGPLRVAPQSLPLVKLWFGILLGVNLMMAIALVIAWRKRRHHR